MQGLAAFRALKRELRQPVSERNDDQLLRLAISAGIKIYFSPNGQRVDAMAVRTTDHVVYDRLGNLVRTDPRFGRHVNETLALASDRTLRAAIRRLLASNPSAAFAAASAPISTTIIIA
jgi:hypothetical protein